MLNISDFLSMISESILRGKFYQSKRVLGLMLCVISISLTAIAAPSDLDPDFGDFGRVLSSPDDLETSFSYGTALQPDGKIVMVGGRADGVSNIGIMVARFNSNGSLDTSFGNNGWTATGFGGTSERGNSVAIQADGKIVVGGDTNVASNVMGITRFTSDGVLDTTFGTNGKVIVAVTNYSPRLSSIKIANDGKIVFGGTGHQGLNKSRVLGKLNADGSFDTSFGSNSSGLLVQPGALLNDLIILSDGGIAVAGYISNQFDNRMIASKYNVNGVIQWSFVRGQDFSISWLFGIAEQPDGKIVVVGAFTYKISAIRLTAGGSDDGTLSNVPLTTDGRLVSVAIQPNGKIVANIFDESASIPRFSVIRYNANGTLDTDFGDNGIARTAITGQDTSGDIFVQPDGKILVGGFAQYSSPTRRFFAMVRYEGDSTAVSDTQFDYDGDGRSDVSLFRSSNRVWYLNQSTNGFSATQFGISTDRIVPADFDGDGRTDIAVYRDGIWWILQSGSNTVIAYQFGLAEDKPQSGDFDGDGKDDLVVFRPSNGVWYVYRSTDQGFSGVQFGLSEDVPQSGDYDGDGKTDYAVFRPSSGVWYIKKSSGGDTSIQFGLSDDIPNANDFDGDGNTDLAVFRPSNGDWYIRRSSDDQVDRINFGLDGDIPVSADYDGDAKADLAIFRPTTGVWYQILSTTGWSQQAFGITNDKPTPSAYNR